MCACGTTTGDNCLTLMKETFSDNKKSINLDRSMYIIYIETVMKNTYYIKTGKGDVNTKEMDIRPFSSQKAKALPKSRYSFPLFIIRKNAQRSSYSKSKGDVKDILLCSDNTQI